MTFAATESANTQDYTFRGKRLAFGASFVLVSIRRYKQTKFLLTAGNMQGTSQSAHPLIRDVSRIKKNKPYVILRRSDFSLHSVWPAIGRSRILTSIVDVIWDYPLLITAMYYWLSELVLKSKYGPPTLSKTLPLKMAFARLRRKDPWFKTISYQDLGTRAALDRIAETADCKKGMTWLSSASL